MYKYEQFKPRYTLDEEGKKEIKAKKIIDLLKEGTVKELPLYCTWYDFRTGHTTEPEYFMVELTSPKEANRHKIVFKVPLEYSSTGNVIKWKIRGTVALSSFLEGRDCIGREGVPYTIQKHLEIKQQLLLNSPNYKNSRFGEIFKYIKQS